MAFKTGRNEPCPCGSGKKYKNCCLDKDNTASGYKPILTNEDDIIKYTEFAERWDRANGPLPTFMEYMGKPNMASKAMAGLSEKMGDMKFKTLKEAQEYLNRKMNADNNRPVDDFLGISPKQMGSLTRSLFADNPDIVKLNTLLQDDTVKGLPVIKQCFYLLKALSENEKGVKLTAKGNLPRAIVQEFFELFAKEGGFDLFKPSGEDDLREIQKIKFFLYDSGFIKKLHGWMSLTKKGRAAYEKFSPSVMYRELFLYFCDVWNWRYGTGFEQEYGYIQLSKIFSLYILKKNGEDYVTAGAVADIYKKAFPSLIERVESKDSYSRFNNGYHYLFFENFTLFLGLVETEDGVCDINDNVRLRITPLFKELFEWMI